MQLLIGDLAHAAVVGFGNDGHFLRLGGQVAVNAVHRRIKFTVGKPAIVWGIRIIENGGERRIPGHELAGLSCPEAFVIVFSFGDQCIVGIQRTNSCAGGKLGVGLKYPVFR
ncbi:hypothetical protein GALL_551540 [mine drainage metagenome]|uniref:Uncharacterized protein n=1 Tax=mine drainage metagenome TaxID=410659 RepID=A0A1J5NX11_9ZZZZ